MKENFLFFIILIITQSTLQGGCEPNEFNGHFSKSTIMKILDNINEKRSLLANGKVTGKDDKHLPSSSNMNMIAWNDELHKKAQGFTEKLIEECKFEHNRDQYVLEGIPVGENIAKNVSHLRKLAENIDNAFIKAINKWWVERKKFHEEFLEKYKFDYYTGHFSQLAWAETSQIGCGYGNFSDDRFKTNEIIVCVFAVEGNDIGRRVYKIGKPCSECEKDLPCSEEYSGLCGVDGRYFEEKVAAHDPRDHKGDPLFDISNYHDN